MVKVIYGRKGSGKTKMLIETANELSQNCKGDVVYIDDDSSKMYQLKHEVRFIDSSHFEIDCAKMFLGFLSGIISQDYDIEAVFIDGLNYIVKEDIGTLQNFFEHIEKLSRKFNVKFYMSISADNNKIPEFLQKYAA